ncbi:MAG: hypothetical protein IPM64_04760 [Phycisphaerales bacterium]|nr:hypothetical protein [Phycisphaerales bacterium]
MIRNSRIARPLAPEDIRPGDFVVPLIVLSEERTFMRTPDQPLIERASLLPTDEQLCVVRVVSVCIPFVLAETHDGASRLIDVRRQRLARLPRAFGRQVFQRMKPAATPAAEAPCDEPAEKV